MSISPLSIHDPSKPMPRVSRNGFFVDAFGHKKKIYRLQDVLLESKAKILRIAQSKIKPNDLILENLEKDFKRSISVARSTNNPFIRAKCASEIINSAKLNLSIAVRGTQMNDNYRDIDQADNRFYRFKQGVISRLKSVHLYHETPRNEKHRRIIQSYFDKVTVEELKSYYDFNKGTLLVSLDDLFGDILDGLASNGKRTVQGTQASIKDEQSLKTLLIRHKVLQKHPTLFERAKVEFQNEALAKERREAEYLPVEERQTEDQIQEYVQTATLNGGEEILEKANLLADCFAQQHGISIDESDIGKVLTLEGGEDPIEITIAVNENSEIIAALNYKVNVQKLTSFERDREHLRMQFPDRKHA